MNGTTPHLAPMMLDGRNVREDPMSELPLLQATRRRHLFEWEDQPWLPTSLRDIITDHLQYAFASNRAKHLRETIVDILEPPLRRSGATQVVDVCSGSGGPLPALFDELTTRMGRPLTAKLTDLYPNDAAFEAVEVKSSGRVHGHLESVSAFDVPEELGSFQTIFTAFHHFSPDDAKRVLADAAKKHRTISIIEPFRRADLPFVAFGGLLRGILATPFIGRMSLARFLWTYPIPLSAMVLAWDGAVSCLRAYEPEEMLGLALEAVPTGYHWEAGRKTIPNSPAKLSITYLIGEPASA
jgi:hypothetical protein